MSENAEIKKSPKSVPVPVAPPVSASPTVSVMGAGGCGINMVRHILGEIGDAADIVRRFDTSFSNVRAGEDLLQVADGDGSGKIRSENAQAIQKKLASYTNEELGLSDINIVIFSASGGSGSVIGPVLIREIERREIDRRKCKAVAVVVADTASERDADNTHKTLQTLQAIAVNNNIYLPTMMFSNAGVGRSTVDLTLTHRVAQLVHLVTLPAIEVDRSDRRNFFNGIKTVQATPGVRLLHVVSGTLRDEAVDSGEIWEHEPDDVFDSTLSIGVGSSRDKSTTFVDISVPARIAFHGCFTEQVLTPMFGMIASGDTGISSLITEIGATLARFNAQSKKVESAIDMSSAAVSDGDLVL